MPRAERKRPGHNQTTDTFPGRRRRGGLSRPGARPAAIDVSEEKIGLRRRWHLPILAELRERGEYQALMKFRGCARGPLHCANDQLHTTPLIEMPLSYLLERAVRFVEGGMGLADDGSAPEPGRGVARGPNNRL